MAINFNSAPSYFWLNSWVLANIIELGTQSFCNRFVNYSIDPGRRLYDQMTQAARSIRANIAEGSGRHNTSYETEMRLTDVARASVHELMGDFINYMMRHSIVPWERRDPRQAQIFDVRLENPSYSDNFVRDATIHILRQKSRYDAFLESSQPADCANALICLCLKITAMLTKMLESQLDAFRKHGGFTENLSQERMKVRLEKAVVDGAPTCPQCGKPMLRRVIKRGARQGQQFWGCSGYPACNATRDC